MKGYRDNGGAAGGFGARNKTVYDDVFGGPPKFGATTLPPRVEDYTEIFQGFHASRGSSIPVLDLPPPYNDSDDVWFDVQSSKLDYSEVFGGFNGLDFAVSYEELFNSSKVEDGDSSDEVWTPAQSESLSDELDPYTSLETNQHVSTSDPVDLFGIKLQNELNLKAEKQLLNGITNDSEFLDVSNKTESEKLFSLANNNHFERKQLKKSFSQPLDRSHLSVSDLSLKTQPSNLPPPSRPPPVLSSKKGDIDFFDSKLKTSKSYGFEKMKGDRSPPYFDVEIDASSSAAADAAAMKDAVEQAQAKLKSAKDKMDRKKEGFQNRSKSNVGDKKEKVNEDERSNGFGNNKEKISLESFEQKQDFKNVLERQETVDVFHKGHEPLKEHTLGQNSCEPKEAEKTVLVEEIKTPSEVDESELYDNLIEIQLKNNDIEPEVKLVRDNENERTLWDDYGEAFEKEHEKELKESEEKDAKDVQQSGPPEIVIITQIEEDDDEHESEEHESMLENPFHCEANESDNISEMVFEEDENKKEQTLDHNEKILEEEFKQDEDEIKEDEGLEQTPNDDMANEDIETIHETNCNSEEDSEIQKDHESEEEIEQKEEVVSENDDESSTVDDNENSQDSVNIQHDITSEKDEFTPQIPIYPINPQKTETNNITSKKDEFTSQIPIYPTNPEKTETNNITSEKDEFTPRIPIYPTNPEKTETTPQPPSSSNSKQSNFEGVEIEVRKTNGVNEETKMENEKKRMERERLEKVREMEKERLRKMEEERERQIEREKDRMAVDRATLEARERAFSETKERTERAAVERATAEYRQRALAEARERLEKACAEARERSLADKAMEGRLRVEKATAEARERAERSVDDKFSGGSRSVGGLRYGQNSAAYNGESESPQRCKARLERHQRTADRAAKALAEKNMRDLLAQKEQAERNRLAESLDAEVKRWCSGKQGNLRALLSTLQYILGSDSGWQPIPLTEVITTAAVKKAYRKATLCVHPDKLQQRGATIQQKYICEKVFDLLKEAWNKFNSEER